MEMAPLAQIPGVIEIEIPRGMVQMSWPELHPDHPRRPQPMECRLVADARDPLAGLIPPRAGAGKLPRHPQPVHIQAGNRRDKGPVRFPALLAAISGPLAKSGDKGVVV